MRNVGIIIMLTLMVLFIACNQNSNTQKSEGTKKSVEEQFAAQFPNATDVEWEH